MSFNPGGGGGISAASDVFLSTPATNHFLTYNGGTTKWQNSSLVGFAALATGGGQETISTANSTLNTALNLNSANVFNITLSVATTIFTFTNAVAGRACSFSLYLRQDGTGSRAVTWPGSVKWSGGAPTLTTTANSVDILVFESIDGGNIWFGSLVGTNFV